MRSWVTFVAVLGVCGMAVAVELPTAPTMPTTEPIVLTGASIAALGDAGTAVTPSRVVVQAVRSTRIPVKLSSKVPVPEDVSAGTHFAGEYIVLYNEDVPDLLAAAESTRVAALELTMAAAQAGQLALAVGADVAAHVRVMSTTPAPPGVPAQALIKVPAELSASSVRAALAASGAVKAVVPNRVVRIAQAIEEGGCTPGHYASAVEAQPVGGAFSWAGCSGEGVGLAAFGERCGADMDKFRWTGLFAYDKASGQMVANCVALRSAEASPARRRQLFGTCGVAPTKLMGLPTHACTEGSSVMPLSSACVEAGSLPAFSVQLSSSLCPAAGPGHSTVTFTGTPCGPGNTLVQWEALHAATCGTTLARATLDAKQQADWVGQCGVPPRQISGLPTRICTAASRPHSPRRAPPARRPAVPGAVVQPPAAQAGLSRTALRQGESTANWGMARIGALAGGRVIDAAGAFASGMRVIVMDTGIERTHPDLNVVEFVDMFDEPGSPDYGVDGHGHGTHVGGVIGAKNQGSGIAGVVPGMPLIAFKVLGRDGSGSLDNVYRGYAELAARQARGDKVVAINLSLGSPVMDAEGLAVECDWVKRLAKYGTTIVAAAGNDGGELLTNTMPAACPDTLSVTSIASDDSPSYFSNLADASSPAFIREKTVTAPGSNIFSTFNNGGYSTLSGTSMATPHATGVVLACYLNGACKLGSPSTTGVIPKVQAAAKAQGCAAGARCGPSWGSDKFYGNAISVRTW